MKCLSLADPCDTSTGGKQPEGIHVIATPSKDFFSRTPGAPTGLSGGRSHTCWVDDGTLELRPSWCQPLEAFDRRALKVDLPIAIFFLSPDCVCFLQGQIRSNEPRAPRLHYRHACPAPTISGPVPLCPLNRRSRQTTAFSC